MLLPEEETVSAVIENGTFYTPTAQVEFKETTALQRATLLLIPGVLLALVLPRISDHFPLTQFLASILLLAGFLPLLLESGWFRACLALSVIQISWAVRIFVYASNLEPVFLTDAIWAAYTYIAAGAQLGILLCFWLGMRRIHPAASRFSLITLVAFCILLVLDIPTDSTPLLIAKVCTGLVCFAALLASAIKVRK